MDELTFIHQLGDNDLFNNISNMDRVHHAIRGTILTYITTRSQLEELIIGVRSTIETNGGMLSTYVDVKDAEVLKPKILEINSLIDQARPMLTRGSTEAKDVMNMLHGRLKEAELATGKLEFVSNGV
jgi:mevalonate kinase